MNTNIEGVDDTLPGWRDDTSIYVNNAYADHVMAILSGATHMLLHVLIGRATRTTDLTVTESYEELGTFQGRSFLSRNSVIAGLRELAALRLIAVTDNGKSTTRRTIRLCHLDEWDWPTIEMLGATRQKMRDSRRAQRADPLWRQTRERVFARDGYACRYCGSSREPLHCDHVTPLSRGGTNDIDNLVTACQSCNLSKSNRTPGEWKPQPAR